ncbi:SURF1 family protein [Bartonella tribocorum]|uniref:SURF1-like protein n=1 Tax=Bartonella tribocorum (strain DSM 28219 / CCUG 45778 / CIP 105476 / IBS 506) TaxID=382640 RepID=A9IZC8_BART1|nr:SURF1 family protein [Bartonella tribocorum]CAK02521.1 SurF1 family protein (Surfeit 1) [Bartonella tribocorum CIP 105476]CDO49857.1 SurF1 family protein (surfeit 1) [Bartonella tribocorum]
MNEKKPPMTKLQGNSCRFSSLLFGALCICFFLLFSALGIWQVQRLNWKTNLITSANQRVHLAPIKAPQKDQWADITFEKNEYQPVVITGKFLIDKNILVTAAAQNTTGYWVLTPLQTADNTLTFINRGFIPMDERNNFQHSEQSHTNASSQQDSTISTEQTTIIGLLRMSEKNGFFPRKNNPDKNVWYTRDLPAMTQKLGLSTVAPYFIDARKTSPQASLPIVGLTIIHFRNNHLVYAITWFILAAGVLGAFLFLLKQKELKNNN